MNSNEQYAALLQSITTHIDAFEKREKSRAEKNYSDAMEDSAIALAVFTRTASFDELMEVEKLFQKNDLEVYAKRPETLATVREAIDDFAAGEAVHKQLVENTPAYVAHKYRKKETLPPENVIPLDAMRRALRGQVKRLENYKANVMGNQSEQAFLSARIAMVRKAENLYDSLQRESLGFQ